LYYHIGIIIHHLQAAYRRCCMRVNLNKLLSSLSIVENDQNLHRLNAFNFY